MIDPGLLMRVHRVREARPMAVRCERCGAEFDTRDQLDEHVREAHPDAPKGGGFICKACGMEFDSQEELDAHATAEHGA